MKLAPYILFLDETFSVVLADGMLKLIASCLLLVESYDYN